MQAYCPGEGSPSGAGCEMGGERRAMSVTDCGERKQLGGNLGETKGVGNKLDLAEG